MEITKDALEYLVEAGKKLSPVQQLNYDGRNYTNRELKPVDDPTVTPLGISTLGSLVELLSDEFEGFAADRHVVHVVSPILVQVVTKKSNNWKEREVLIHCALTEISGLEFGKFHTQEKFLIGLLSGFGDSGDRNDLAKLAGNATAEQVTTAIDDGVTQMISMRAGATLQDTKAVKGLVRLAPWRTFRDVAQPESLFLFRVQKQGDLPMFALFEADGGAWKLEAVANIARKLSAGLTEATVVS